MGSPLKVGVVGVGNISQQYFEHFPALPGLALTAVADLDVERALPNVDARVQIVMPDSR